MESYKFRAKAINDNVDLKVRIGDWLYFTLQFAWYAKLGDLIDWSTLGMWIGKVDEKGKEIYTGDVCKNGDWVEDAHAYNYREEEVIYDPPSGSYLGWNHNEDGMCCEVIGTKFDTPDQSKKEE